MNNIFITGINEMEYMHIYHITTITGYIYYGLTCKENRNTSCEFHYVSTN